MDTKTQNRQNETGIPPLSQLYVYLTDGCNLACRHCWLAPKYERTGKGLRFLPKELLAEVIDEARDLGLTTVKLTGGEPLLHPDFKALVRMTADRGLRLNVETNGLLCDATVAAEIARVPRRFAAVSIDGVDAATHDRIRGVPGAFEKACAAVRHLSGAGVSPQVIMTVMADNVDQVRSMISLAEAIGAESLKFNVVQPTARGRAMYEEGRTPGVRDLIDLGRRIDEEWSAATNLRLMFDLPMAFRPIKHMLAGDGCAVCGIFGILGLLPDGHYALCGIGSHVPELVFGRAGRDRLAEVWGQNPTLQGLREGLPRRLEGICGRCLMKGSCLGACLAQNYYRHHTLWGPHWFCEAAAQAGLFPETRLIPEKEIK